MSANARFDVQLDTKQAAQVQTMQMRTAGEPVKAPRKASQYDGMPYYNRPAGAFHSIPYYLTEDGVSSVKGYIVVKPFSDYTYHAVPNGYNPEDGYTWFINRYGWDNTREGQDVTLNYTIGEFEPPILCGSSVQDGSGYFQYPYFYKKSGFPPIVDNNLPPSAVISAVSIEETYGYDLLLSSKTFLLGGRNSDYNYTTFTYYSGLLPYGNNASGWWFGKNAGTNSGARIDGIAQAFERPEHPYLLRQVALQCTGLKVSAPVDITCKVYKLNEIPAYNDTASVTLPEVPGELIARGRATVTPSMADDYVFFNLYDDEDGLEYDIAPTIDCAILVVVDGYNDPWMENLLDFSALISSDFHTDEGFGELAYLKVGFPEDGGGNYRYRWCGLNNFFLEGEMKTGLSIYVTLDHPFVRFLYPDEECGKYFFSAEGGSLQREYNHETVNGIAFFSSDYSSDQDWTLTCNGSPELPDWLDIELIDREEGPNGYTVIASVTAKPLPKRKNYREAVVRFEIPGDYIDFKFMQGKESIDPIVPDVNLILRIILGGHVSEDDRHFADINKDGVVNISDLNEVLEYIIGE